MPSKDIITVALDRPALIMTIRMPRFFSLRLKVAGFLLALADCISGDLIEYQFDDVSP